MKIASYNIPEKIDWITAIAEFLFVILGQAPIPSNANTSSFFIDGCSTSSKKMKPNQSHSQSQSSSSSWKNTAVGGAQRSAHLISLAPYVASLLLSTIFGTNIPPSLDWIFWGLAKVTYLSPSFLPSSLPFSIPYVTFQYSVWEPSRNIFGAI